MLEAGTDLSYASACLKQGKTVAIPTETVYGLAANALAVTAVAEIFRIKNRPAFDPLIVHVASLEEATPYVALIPDLVKRLYAQLGPGPITYILPKSQRIPDLVTAGHATVGIRIPDHPLTLALLKLLDFPLAAPSANPFGFTSPTTAQHVADQLGSEVAYILDGGPCRVGLESTILDASGDKLKVLRLGGLSLEQLEVAAGRSITEVQLSSSNPQAPGMLTRHYNPGKKLLLGAFPALLANHSLERTALLTFKDYYASFPIENQYVLAPDGEMSTAASRLFAGLRALAQLDVDLILAESLPEIGLGRAINDRLRRAAAQ
jgi:L-threonylcarbamoyladenylate synthase